jgi:cation diffusion facilitator CzcD-associated flavoprotein CzcO
MYFALRDELQAYLDHVAEKFGLRSHIRFETEVKSAHYDKASQRWAGSQEGRRFGRDPQSKRRNQRGGNLQSDQDAQY